MSESLDLEERLASYGQVLGNELATWPAFNPATMAATSPLLLLRRWRGRWPGAGHRPLLAFGVLAAIAVAIVLAVVATASTDETSTDGTRSDGTGAAASPQVPAAADAPAITSDDASSETAVPAPTATPAPTTTPAPAATPTPSFSCGEGLLVNERCRIAVPVSSSARSDACTAQGGVAGGDTGCSQIVDALTSCPAGAEAIGSGCAVSSPARQTIPTCPTGSELVAQSCQRTTSPAPACNEGQLIEDVCRIEQAPAKGGELSCAGGAPVTNGECTVWTAGDCGSATAVSGGCIQPAPVEKREVCPADTVLKNSRCEPTDGCPPNTSSKVANACGSPAVTELVCSATGQPVGGTECVAIVAPTCPSGFRAAGNACATERAAGYSAYRCEAGQLRIGTSCFDEQPAAATCAEGELVGGICVVTEPAASSAPACSVGANLAGQRCLVPAEAERSCAIGTLEGDACRVAIDLDPAELCDPGQIYDYGWCVRFEDPVVS